MERLKEAVRDQPSQDPHEFSFITFNYDVCLEAALEAYGIRYDYFLEGGASPGVTPLLKLHGSINWGLDRKEATPTIAPAPISQMRFNALGLADHVCFNVGSLLNGLGINGRVLDGPPVIVPPSWNKNSYHGQLSNVWAKASQELASAENIVVIGYSLPETDSFFRYLFALGTESPTTIRKFTAGSPAPCTARRGRPRSAGQKLQAVPVTRTRYLPGYKVTSFGGTIRRRSVRERLSVPAAQRALEVPLGLGHRNTG